MIACSLCDFQAFSKGNLTFHLNSVHFKDKEYMCRLCHFKTAYKGERKLASNPFPLSLVKARPYVYLGYSFTLSPMPLVMVQPFRSASHLPINRAPLVLARYMHGHVQVQVFCTQIDVGACEKRNLRLEKCSLEVPPPRPHVQLALATVVEVPTLLPGLRTYPLHTSMCTRSQL